ncbi:Tetratricopeptide TPR_2 repeat protein (plasmid) [Herpetosiphon aurantiacus DSM 785]|uniref:Tetratricopeptide TPR_2 repeat protein n=1 Tax=Herpetosiphon aurantiacus (strain ATCC 23779 / DSM 785 / 114-95) TaxID=316274 RepID=A9B9A2_HERA2|nr:Tetratricopeptide TPR_2 repeat protein [Herpetosiphon aurantiacus DSM 785]
MDIRTLIPPLVDAVLAVCPVYERATIATALERVLVGEHITLGNNTISMLFGQNNDFSNAKIMIGSIQAGHTISINVQPIIDKSFSDSTHTTDDDLKQARLLLSHIPLASLPKKGLLPKGSRIPFKDNPFFVGRDDMLLSIASTFFSCHSDAPIPTIGLVGMGGIGKTQLAVEFVYRYGSYFAGGIFWLSFAQPDSINTEVIDCYKYYCPQVIEDSAEKQIAYMKSLWMNPLPRLLVFDDCNEVDLLEKWRPQSGGCYVLVTSRRQQWPATVELSLLSVSTLDLAGSLDLLCLYRPDIREDQALGQKIAQKLANLPLAIHMAGSYLAHYKLKLEVYLAQLDQGITHESMKGRGTFHQPTNHESVNVTFNMALNNLSNHEPVNIISRLLLARTSWLMCNEPIPKTLLQSFAVDKGYDDLDIIDSIHKIVNLGLLEITIHTGFRIHELIAGLIKDKINDVSAYSDVERILGSKLASRSTWEEREELQWLIPHAYTIVQYALKRQDTNSADFMYGFARSLKRNSDYKASFMYHQKALAIRKKIFGDNHVNTAKSLNMLGMLCRKMANFNMAKEFYEQALEIYQRDLGDDHPTTLSTLNNLGYLLKAQGDLLQARECYQKVLKSRLINRGEEHRTTGTIFNNLGMVLKDLGDLKSAQEHVKKAVEIRKRICGDNHPDTLIALYNLASILFDLGLIEDSYKVAKSVLDDRCRILGDEHSSTASSLYQVGKLLHTKGEIDSALYNLEKALTIQKKLLGIDNPYTALTLQELGRLFQSKGEFELARHNIEYALGIQQRIFGLNHPAIGLSFHNLGELYEKMGNLQIAHFYYKQALEVRIHILGENHPSTIGTIDCLNRSSNWNKI